MTELKKLVNEYILPYESLIGGYTIPDYVCDEVIDYHKKSDLKTPGIQYFDGKSMVDYNIKESVDVHIRAGRCPDLTSYFESLEICLDRYLMKYYFANEVQKFNIIEQVNIQHYKPGGGFKNWHMENSGGKNHLNRHLVFMTYLNDVDDGGTEFLYQGLKTPAKKGLTVIWPANWTHTHKGEVSKTKEKYIITGWYSFDRSFDE